MSNTILYDIIIDDNLEDFEKRDILEKALTDPEVRATINNRIDEEGNTVLHIAGMRNLLNITILLREHGATLFAKNKNGKIPHQSVYSALVKSGHEKLILAHEKNLKEKKTSQFLNDKIATYFFLKLAYDADLVLFHNALNLDGDIEFFSSLYASSFFINAIDDNGNSALHIAAACKNNKFIEVALKLGAIPNRTNVERQTPLDIALMSINEKCNFSELNDFIETNYKRVSTGLPLKLYGYFQTVYSLIIANKELEPNLKSSISATSELLRYIIDILNVHKNFKEPATKKIPTLHQAASLGDNDQVRALLKSTPIDAIDVHGNTALHNAAACGKLECIKILLSANPKIIQNIHGKTAIDLAAENKHIDCVQPLKNYLDEQAKKSQLLAQQFFSTPKKSKKSKSKKDKKKKKKAAIENPAQQNNEQQEPILSETNTIPAENVDNNPTNMVAENTDSNRKQQDSTLSNPTEDILVQPETNKVNEEDIITEAKPKPARKPKNKKKQPKDKVLPEQVSDSQKNISNKSQENEPISSACDGSAKKIISLLAKAQPQIEVSNTTVELEEPDNFDTIPGPSKKAFIIPSKSLADFGIDKNDFTPELLEIISAITEQGHLTVIKGGAPRSWMLRYLNMKPCKINDFDLVTTMPFDELKKLPAIKQFSHEESGSGVEKTLKIKTKLIPVEISSADFSLDSIETIMFAADITANTFCVCLSTDLVFYTDEALKHLGAKAIVTVGYPEELFARTPHCMLRIIRFEHELQFTNNQYAYDAIAACAHLLQPTDPCMLTKLRELLNKIFNVSFENLKDETSSIFAVLHSFQQSNLAKHLAVSNRDLLLGKDLPTLGKKNIFMAALDGDIDQLRAYYNLGYSFNKIENHITILMSAIASTKMNFAKKIDCICFILLAGADIDLVLNPPIKQQSPAIVFKPS